MKKESLTNKHISEEVKETYRWKDTLVLAIVLGIMGVALVSAGTWLYNTVFFEQLSAQILYAIFLITVSGGTFTLIVCIVVSTYQRRRAIDRCSYRVVVDRLTKTGDDRGQFIDGNGAGIHRHLIFASFGKYALPKKTYYAWSKYAMTDEGICNTSTEDDTFYIVTTDNKSILIVYNTKFFDYKE